MGSATHVRYLLVAGACSLLPVSAAHADVTLEQSMKVDGPLGMLNMSGQITTTISGNRSRTQNDLRMESRLMRMFAPGETAEIVQLDPGVFYGLNMKKKTYTETSLEEQRQAMQKSIEQMREAQESQQQRAAGVDESECEWSEPTASVERPGDAETIAGYKAERTVVTASQSCKDPKTGQECSFNLVLDQWLAPDFEAGDEVQDYYRTYAEKLGLDVAGSPGFTQRLESMFGAYQGIWKEIAEEMQQVEGYPVRTSVSLAVGGPQCDTSQAQTAEGQGQGQGQGQGAGRGSGVNEAVGGVVGREVLGDTIGGAIGGLFGRRRDRQQAEAAQEEEKQQPAVAAAPAEDSLLPAGTTRLMSITTELTRVSDEAVPASMFEVPENFRKVKR